jgi:endonuclease V-like protein UPF0215 family
MPKRVIYSSSGALRSLNTRGHAMRFISAAAPTSRCNVGAGTPAARRGAHSVDAGQQINAIEPVYRAPEALRKIQHVATA